MGFLFIVDRVGVVVYCRGVVGGRFRFMILIGI